MRKTIDQLPASENDRDEELSPRVLRPSDPNAPLNIAVYSLKEKQFIVNENSSSMILHVSKSGTLKMQVNRSPFDGPPTNTSTENPLPSTVIRNIIRNQFEFNERGSETINPAIVSGGVTTHPPPTRNYTGVVSQSVIRGKYAEFMENGRRKTATAPVEEGSIILDETLRNSVESDLVEKQVVKSEIEPVYSDEMELSGIQMERILLFNCEQRIYQDLVDVTCSTTDFVMHALWKFTNSRTKNKSVTAITWNPKLPDLFAVAYGSFDYSRHFSGSSSLDGYLAIFSLKNVNCPQRIFASTAICSIDWHPTRPSLIAIGMYDGNVAVADIVSEDKDFVYSSKNDNVDHSDPIWELHWIDSTDAPLGFESVSSNGRVMSWRVERSKLESECVFQLCRADLTSTKQPALSGLFTGLCLDYGDEILIGTEEGAILKCSQSLQSTDKYIGHLMAPVYAVKRNPFDGRIFASCSADWTVKLWHSEIFHEPLCTFETGQGAAVGDLAWSPVVSTMFATVNGDGTVYVFDVNKNRTSAIVSKKLLKKGKLTRISFNDLGTLILVGDERGVVYSFKVEYGTRDGDEKVRLKNVVEVLKNSTTAT